MRSVLTRAALVAALTVALTPALGVTWASACSCVGATDAESAARADAVFVGTLTGTTAPRSARSSTDPVTYTFAVSRVYKGQVARTQPVGSVISGASCGLELAGTGPFVVFASAEQPGRPALQADLCGGTRPVGAGVDPSLGAGYDPMTAVPVAAATPSDAGDSAPALLALGALALLAAGALAAEPRRRRRSASAAARAR